MKITSSLAPQETLASILDKLNVFGASSLPCLDLKLRTTMIFERIKDKYYEAKEKGKHIAYICKTPNSPSWFVFFPDSQEWLEARPSDSREQAINRFRQFKKFSLADSNSMKQQSKEYLIEFTALRLVAACRQRDKDLVLAIKEWSSWDWDEAVSRLTIEEVEFISSCV